MAQELELNQLRKEIDASSLNFDSIEDIQPLETIIGQERVVKALKFGIGNKGFGYNIYASGLPGTGKLDAVKSFIAKKAQTQDVPPDICYVNNFEDEYCPRKLLVPAGTAKKFRKDMKNLVKEVKESLTKAFESDEFSIKKEKTVKNLNKDKKDLFLELNSKAKDAGFSVKESPLGIMAVPLNDNGEPLKDEEFEKLDKDQQQNILKKQEEVQNEINNVLKKSKNVENKMNEKLGDLEKEVADNIITPIVENLKDQYENKQDIHHYLEKVKNDILENIDDFKPKQQQNQGGGGLNLAQLQPQQQQTDIFKKYDVNILVDNSGLKGAPMIQELNPSYNNLFGKVEKESKMGALTTDFTLIKAGALHQANGGYLVIPVMDLFKAPFAWESLKRAIKNKEIKIEEVGEKFGFLTTKSVNPEPISFRVQVILIGRPEIYQLLYAYDPDFRDLFKVKAEFDTSLDRSEENIRNYVAYIAKIKKQEELLSFDKSAISKIIEYGSRLASDQNKISSRFSDIYDIILESNYFAQEDGNSNGTVKAEHVRQAVEEKTYRSNLIQEKFNEMIRDNMIYIDVQGRKTGQINGLSVLNLQDIMIGKPNRITATTSVGADGIIDIEREAKLSGPIHSKGVLILSGYLSEKYGSDKPVNLSARIVFEQSYSEIEGDSASCAELCTLLSNLSNVPMKQGIAITGSINQKGDVQAVGGINEKIEGYYEVCKLHGLNGEQGVVIPESNVKSLMLKEDIIEAVKEGKFHIYSVKNVDEAMEILTDKKAGEKRDGKYEEDTINALVDERINVLAEKVKEYVQRK